MNKNIEKQFANHIIDEINDTILNIMENSYNTVIKNFQLESVKLSYTLDGLPHINLSNPLSLTEYLFIKSKCYTLEHLLTLILQLNDMKALNYQKLDIKLLAPIFFVLNDLTLDTEKSFDKNLKSHDLYKKYNNLKKRTQDVISSFHIYPTIKLMDRSSPYLYYKSIFEYQFNYDFFHKDIIFYTTFKENTNINYMTNSFAEYIELLIHLMYKNTKMKIKNSSNLIKLSNTILAYITNENNFSEYSKIENLIDKMDNDIKYINSIYKSIWDEKNKSKLYSFHHLINTYYHNNFITSIHHPFIKVLFKRIDMKELYNVICTDNSSYLKSNKSWSNISESYTLIENFSVKDSAYNLRLLELMMKFDINLYQITFDDLYYLNGSNESILKKDPTNKSYNYQTFTLFKSNRYNFLKEQKLVFDITIDFIYDYLENFENLILDEITHIVSHIENTYSEIQNNQNNIFLNCLIEEIITELDYIYNIIPYDLDFNEINFQNNYDQYYSIIRNYPFLFTYLIKQGFIKG